MSEAAAPQASSAELYWEVDAELAPDAEEVWGLFCYELGALGAVTVDEAPGRLLVRHYFAALPFERPDTWLSVFGARFPGARPPAAVTLRNRAREAWETAWRAHFKPIALGRRLLVCPPWPADEPPQAAGSPPRLRLVIEPGQGFGTGWHPSTALALEVLEARLLNAPPPERLLDVGAGSGILSIAAARLGVPWVCALDVDPRCLPEVRRNFAHSGLPAPQALVQGRADCLRRPFPLVAANIVAGVLLEHRGDLAGLTQPGGCLILSGILEHERGALLGAYAALGLRPAQEARREGWYACCLQRA